MKPVYQSIPMKEAWPLCWFYWKWRGMNVVPIEKGCPKNVAWSVCQPNPLKEAWLVSGSLSDEVWPFVSVKSNERGVASVT